MVLLSKFLNISSKPGKILGWKTECVLIVCDILFIFPLNESFPTWFWEMAVFRSES